MRALGRSSGVTGTRGGSGRPRRVPSRSLLVVALVFGPPWAHAESQKLEPSQRDEQKPRLSTSRLLGQGSPIQSLGDIRKAAARPSETSRRELLLLSADPNRNSDPALRVELARALRAAESSKADSAITIALVSLLDSSAKEDALGLEALAREVAAMALRRSPDPLARKALEARARDDEPTLGRAAARKAVDLDAITKDEAHSTPVLSRESSEPKDRMARALARTVVTQDIDEAMGGRGLLLAPLLNWLNDESEEVRRATCERLEMHLRAAPSSPESTWIEGALAERYRIEPSARVRRSLVTILARAPASRARVETLSLAADLDSDRTARNKARLALEKPKG